MAGRGPAPANNRRRRAAPLRGEWSPTPGSGWQHSETVPDPPNGLRPGTLEAWTVWMASWFAARWTVYDLPGLRIVIGLYDECEAYREDPYVEKTTRKGDSIFVLRPNPVTELRQLMDNYGITPKGQQDRRWAPPKPDEKPEAPKVEAGGRYAHLRAVG